MWDAWWRLGTPEELAAILGHRPFPGNKSKAWEQGRFRGRYSCHFGLQSGFLLLLFIFPPSISGHFLPIPPRSVDS